MPYPTRVRARSRLAVVASLVLALAGAEAAWAQTPSLPSKPATLDLSEALARASASDPALAAWDSRQSAAEANIRQAGVRPNPSLGVELENFAGTGAYSLLETAAARGWQLGLALERALAGRVPVIGTSLVLNPTRLNGRFRGYPYEDGSLEQLASSPLRRLSLLPSVVRRRILQDLAREVTAVAAFAGPPSVAHAEALLRGIARRSTRVEQPLDAIVIGMPWKHHHAPRERLNPITVATMALGLALRLWRNSFPVAEGGTAIILHRLSRHFAHGAQEPYRELFHALRDGRTAADVAEAERLAAADERGLAAYRGGRACHPRLPYSDWESCRPALDRLGAVLVAGSRDHQAARTLGFVPTHGLSSAIEMAHGRAGGHARIGLLLGPPYFPLEVSGAAEGYATPR